LLLAVEAGGGEDSGDSYGHGGGLTGTSGYMAGTQTAAGTNGGLGYGGSTNFADGGGGGGGYYGGGTTASGSVGSDSQGGGGGSGYIGTLTNAATFDGTKTFMSPTDSNETGHFGNGYARITRY